MESGDIRVNRKRLVEPDKVSCRRLLLDAPELLRPHVAGGMTFGMGRAAARWVQ